VIMRAVLERAELRAAHLAPERPRIRNITNAPAKGCRVVLERPVRPAHATTSVASPASI